MQGTPIRKMEIPRVPEHEQSFEIPLPYTPCGKNHTFHTEEWPTSGIITIGKCERQCRFRACKAWSQTAAALRKHVNAHILNTNLDLRIAPATNGREPLRILPENNILDTVSPKKHVSAPVSTPGATSFTSFNTSAASTHSDSGYASPKSSNVQPDVETTEYEWDMSNKKPDLGQPRKRLSSFSNSVSPKRIHAEFPRAVPDSPSYTSIKSMGTLQNNTRPSACVVDQSSLTDLVEQVMGIAQETDLKSGHLRLPRSQLPRLDYSDSASDNQVKSQQPKITEAAYIHKLDNLMARVQLLYETRTQASLPNVIGLETLGAKDASPRPREADFTGDEYAHRLDRLMARVQQLREMSFHAPLSTLKERSPFREGSPLAPSSSDCQESDIILTEQDHTPRDSVSVYARENTISPRLMSLQYQDIAYPGGDIEHTRNQNNIKSPSSHDYFALQDFASRSSSSMQGKEVQDRSPTTSVERQSPASQNARTKRPGPLPSIPHTEPEQIYEEWTSYVRKLNEESNEESNELVHPSEMSLEESRVEAMAESTTIAKGYMIGRSYEQQFSPKDCEAPEHYYSSNSDQLLLSTNTRLRCPTCHKPVLTKGDLKCTPPLNKIMSYANAYRKHDLRHKKAYRCGLPGCTLLEGLSTASDLARHIKSRHPSYAPSDIVRRYKCHFPGCRSKDKTWPRLDNFRSHLKRVHSYHLTEVGAENVVHGAQSTPSAEVEAVELEKSQIRRLPDTNIDDLLDLQSPLHVLADSAVLGQFYSQWPHKDDSPKHVP